MSGLASTPSRGVPTYEEFYGLRQSPFSLAPDPQFLYLSASHDEAIRLLLQATQRNEAFVVLTGDIGTGKTTVSRALVGQLDATTFASLILNPFLSVEELLHELLLDFGIISRDGVRSGRVETATAHELTRTLHEFLLSLVPLGGKAVLIIDEAHHLSPAVLEHIRVISNLETNTTRLLQIMLVGQPTLLDVLARADMRQLDQRVSLRAMLRPLTRPELEAYVTHRLTIAQGEARVHFEPEALDAVHALTNGVPRPINLLCDRALMLGAQSSTDLITPAIIEESARILDMHRRTDAAPVSSPNRALGWKLVAGAVAVAALLVLAFAPLDRLVDAPLPELPERPRVRIAPSIAQHQPPDEIPPELLPQRPRPLPAF